jgi:two-component system OmpR family response regulator
VNVIVVGDERSRRETVAMALRDAGWEAHHVGTGEDLPPVAGLVVLLEPSQQMAMAAAEEEVPVLSLPAEWSSSAQVAASMDAAGSVARATGLADDTTPGPRLPATRPPLVAGDLIVDEDAHSVQFYGQNVELTRREFVLLSMLIRHANRVLSREALLERVWSHDAVTPNTIEVHISSLRRKLEAHGPRLIFTVRRVGYVLRTSGDPGYDHQRRRMAARREELVHDRDAAVARREELAEQRRRRHVRH